MSFNISSSDKFDKLVVEIETAITVLEYKQELQIHEALSLMELKLKGLQQDLEPESGITLDYVVQGCFVEGFLLYSESNRKHYFRYAPEIFS